MSENVTVTEAFDAVVQLAHALKVPMPILTWVHRVDENWTVAVNAKAEPVRVEPEGGMPVDVPRFHMAVWWNGWLASLSTPQGGGFAAHPDGANENRFIADVQAAIERAKATA